MRNFIIEKLRKTEEVLDLSGVLFDNDELEELVMAINNKPVIKTLILENSAINSQQARILAKSEHVTSLNLDRNDIGFSEGFRALCMNPTIRSLNFNRNALNTQAALFLLNDLKRDDLSIKIEDGNTFTFEARRQISRKYNPVSDENISPSSPKIFKSKDNSDENNTYQFPKIECKIF